MSFENRLSRILWEVYEDGCRRCEADLWRFVGPLYDWIDELLQHALATDWRDRLGAYLDSWEPEGFEVEPDQRRILEDWVEDVAEFRGLHPVESAVPHEASASSPDAAQNSAAEAQTVAGAGANPQLAPIATADFAHSDSIAGKTSRGIASPRHDPAGNERAGHDNSVFIPLSADFPTKERIAAAKSRESHDRQQRQETYDERTRQVMEARGAMGQVLAGRWRYNQDLLDYYQRIMEQMVLVGNALFDGGFKQLSDDLPIYRVEHASNGEPGSSGKLYTQRAPDTVKVYFPENWPRLRDAIVYSKTHYNEFGVFKVDLSAGQNAHNVGGFPGIAISREAFYGTERDAISELIHEPMHDVGFGWLWLGIGHKLISKVVPTDDSAGQDAFTRFFDFLNFATGKGGKSLWLTMLSQSGHRPAKPWRDSE